MAITGMKQNKIGVFDSGVGGLNVLKVLIENRFNNYYIYYGDTKNIPYGNKSKNELMSYASHIIEIFISLDINTIIIACGTISSTIFDELVNKYPNIKLISIVDGVIDYINQSNYNNVLLIATENTINNGYFNKHINKNLITLKAPEFVPIIENILEEKYDYYIDYYLKDMKDKNIDTIILGCTHYPLLKDKIESYLNVKSLDMSYYILNNISNNDSFKLDIYFSKVNDKVIKNVNNIIGDYVVKEVI